MTKFKKQIFAVLTAGAVLVNLSTPALAATEITISGNGAETDNTAIVKTDNTTTVVQSNNAFVTNNVDVDANTGGNKANDNGGGEVSIETNDATANVTVSNDLNSNVAAVDCCPSGNTEVKISGNLRDSDNKVILSNDNETGIFQANNAYVTNSVYADASTGDNKANDNIGSSVEISTGKADTSVSISTEANRNTAVVGGENGEENGKLSAWIVGNGAESDNKIKLDLDRHVAVLQDNMAYVYNYVDSDANTGHNKANDNGGEVSIETNDATANVDIDNEVNFNTAFVDCGCLLDLKAKIAENLSESDNTIKAYLTDDEEVFQDNWADLYNDPYVDANSGYNKANDNLTGGGDPSIETGEASVKDVKINNSGNENWYGADLLGHLPEVDVELSWEFSFLRALFGIS